MVNDAIALSSGGFINNRSYVKGSKSKIEHLRDLFHSEDKLDAVLKSRLQFSKYNMIVSPSASRKSEQLGDTKGSDPNVEFVLPLEEFILVMPPGTIFGAPDTQGICHFTQRIQNWNMCRCGGITEMFSDKWDDVLNNMAVENISPFPVYLKLFLKTTQYFIAMSNVGIHIYSIGEQSTQTIDEITELEDIIIAKLNGSREDRKELKHIITEILFDSATQNIQHPRVEVERQEEGDFLLVTLKLKMDVELDCEQPVVHPPELNEVTQNAVDSQGTTSGQEQVVLKVNYDAECSLAQTENSNTCDDPHHGGENECRKQRVEDDHTLKKTDNICTQDVPEQKYNMPVHCTLNEINCTMLVSVDKESSSKERASVVTHVSEIDCEGPCSPEETHKLQVQKNKKIPYLAIWEATETEQSHISNSDNIAVKESYNVNDKYIDVDLCMTVDIASDEECDTGASSNGSDDLSILDDVEMYSVASPGHGLWSANENDVTSNTVSEPSKTTHPTLGDKVLCENANLSDKDLTCAIQNRFKNIRVYQNKKVKTAKVKENNKKCNKENSEAEELTRKPESETTAISNIDAANPTSKDINDINYRPRVKTKADKCNRFMDTLFKQKLKLLQVDPTVDLKSENVYVSFRKKMIPPSERNDESRCNPIYCCGLCRERFGCYKDLISHTHSHNTNRVITVTVYMPKVCKAEIAHGKCKECGQACDKDGKCMREDEFLCENCGELFHSSRRLWSHKKNKHLPREPQKPSFCAMCGAKFVTSSGLRCHTNLRHGNMPRVTCNDCGKTFKTKSQIARHTMIHLGLKPFECIVCGMRFGVKMRWREHMYLHTGMKPYNCDVCSQDFRHMSALSLHKKMHRLGKI